MKHQRLFTTGLLLGGMTLAGCAKDGSSTPSPSPSGPGGGVTPATKPMTGSPAPSSAAPAAMPAKEMTHVVSMDAPYMTSPGGPAAGTLPKGTKVLLLIPGETAQVETADGRTLYTKIDALESAAPPPPPAMRPMAASPSPVPTPTPSVAATTRPVAAAAAMPAGKEMTHWVTKEQPYFDGMPMGEAKPVGKLAGGSKVLLLIPGTPYCQVETADGKQVYTMIDGVELIPAKK